MYATQEIRYQSLYDAGRSLTFFRDAEGNFPLDTLSKHALANYLFAGAVIGLEYAHPHLTPSAAH